MCDLPATGDSRPCNLKVLYREVIDSIDSAIVIVLAVETGEDAFGTIYLMNSYAHDAASDRTLRDSMEVLDVKTAADAQRAGIARFDSLVRQLDLRESKIRARLSPLHIEQLSQAIADHNRL